MTRLFAGTPFDRPPECDLCGKRGEDCVCTSAEKEAAEAQKRRQEERIPPGKQTARVNIEKRKGKRVVTVVAGLTAAANDLPALLKNLQSVCGAGGTVKSKEDQIELQGDHAERVRQALSQIGYRVR